MVTADFWADVEAQLAEHQLRARDKVAQMEAAGYTVTSTQSIHTCRVTVTSKDIFRYCPPSGRVIYKSVYRKSTSSTAGYAFAVDAAFAKWQAHRETVA